MTIYKLLAAIGAMGLGLTVATSALAIPNLQLYIEGATYETGGADPETWAKLGTDSFRLWVIADTSESYRLRDVKLVASFADGLTPSLSFQASTTGGAGGFTDPSVPDADLGLAGIQQPIGPSGSPFEEGGFDAENWSHGGGDSDINPSGPLETHGMLTHGRSGAEWNLGLFDLIDSPIADFQIPGGGVYTTSSGLPAPTTHSGQINVYTVNVSGLNPGEQVHFDVYGVIQDKVTIYTISCSKPGTVPNPGGQCTGQGNSVVQTATGTQWVDRPKPGNLALLSYENAPYSHDARWEQIDLPAPGTSALLLGGLAGLCWISWRQRRARGYSSPI